jgi:hypothetical protein
MFDQRVSRWNTCDALTVGIIICRSTTKGGDKAFDVRPDIWRDRLALLPDLHLCRYSEYCCLYLSLEIAGHRPNTNLAGDATRRGGLGETQSA